MLPRQYRLNKDKEIKNVLREGKHNFSLFVKVYSIPNELSFSRITCVVGKTVHKSSVKRHFLQRRLRAIAWQVIKKELKDKSYDFVWVAQPKILTINKQEQLREEVVKELKDHLV